MAASILADVDERFQRFRRVGASDASSDYDPFPLSAAWLRYLRRSGWLRHLPHFQIRGLTLRPAFPIRAYQLIPDPNQPQVVALAIETDQGHSLFLATRTAPRSRR